MRLRDGDQRREAKRAAGTMKPGWIDRNGARDPVEMSRRARDPGVVGQIGPVAQELRGQAGAGGGQAARHVAAIGQRQPAPGGCRQVAASKRLGLDVQAQLSP